MRYFNLAVIAILLGVLGVSAVAAQSDTGWQVVNVERAQDLVGTDRNLRFLTLSPDGTTLAWDEDEQLCLYPLEAGETACYPYPDKFAGTGGPYWTLLWSPDSQHIALTEDLAVRALDSDIWLFDVTDHTFTDHTDDQYEGMWISPTTDTPPMLDYAPAWNPTNGDLYFFRWVRYSDGGTIMSLNMLSPAREGDKMVVDMTGEFNLLSIFLPPVVSPDGKTLAFVMLSQDLTDPKNGVWTLNLQDGTHQQVMTIDQLHTGLPEWAFAQDGIVYPDALRWVGNDALVTTLLNSSQNGIPQAAYYLDLTSGDVTSLTDFTNLANFDELNANSDDVSSPIYRLPRSGVVTPDGSAFIYLGANPPGTAAVISAVALPPGDAPEALQIHQIEDFQVSEAAAGRPVISNDGKVALLTGYLIMLEHE